MVPLVFLNLNYKADSVIFKNHKTDSVIPKIIRLIV